MRLHHVGQAIYFVVAQVLTSNILTTKPHSAHAIDVDKPFSPQSLRNLDFRSIHIDQPHASTPQPSRHVPPKAAKTTHTHRHADTIPRKYWDLQSVSDSGLPTVGKNCPPQQLKLDAVGRIIQHLRNRNASTRKTEGRQHANQMLSAQTKKFAHTAATGLLACKLSTHQTPRLSFPS